MTITIGTTTGMVAGNSLLSQAFSATNAGMAATTVSTVSDTFCHCEVQSAETIPLAKLTPLAYRAAALGAAYLLSQAIGGDDAGAFETVSPIIAAGIFDFGKAKDSATVTWRAIFSQHADLANEAGRGDRLSTLALIRRARNDQTALSALIGTASGSSQVAKIWAETDAELENKIVAGEITEDVVYKLDLLMNIGGEATDAAIAKVIESQGAANVVLALVTRGIAPAETLRKLLNRSLLAKELAESVAKGDNLQSINFARGYLLDNCVSRSERDGKVALFTALANEAGTSFRVFSLLKGINEVVDDFTLVYDAFCAINITSWAERLNQGGENLADVADANVVFNFLLSIDHTGAWNHVSVGCEKGDNVVIDLVSPLAEQGNQRAMDALVKSGQTERIASVVVRGQEPALKALAESALNDSKGVDALAYLITNDLYPDALDSLAEIARIEDGNTAALDKLIELAEKRDDALNELIGLVVVQIVRNEPRNFSMQTVGRIRDRMDERSPGLMEKIQEKLWSARS